MKVRYSYLKQQFANCDDLWKDLKIFVSTGDFTLGKPLQKFERSFAKLIGTKYAVGVNSGTDAIKLSLKALNVNAGDEVITSANTFVATVGAINEIGAKTVFVDCDDKFCMNVDQVESKITSKTKLILVENPGSNTFEFQDLKKIISLAKKNKIYTAIDNTWGTPYLLKPIKLGFDMSIVSATKYYSGHSDVMGGSLAINKRVFKLVEATNRVTGLRMSPDDAYLVLRGIRTLDVRMDKHQINALKVAKFLSKQKKVVRVFYPYKKGSKNYQMWKKYYSGASGLMGLKIKSKNKNSVKSFVNSLKLFGYGFSWGGFESLALYQNHKQLGARSFTNLKKDEHIIRLHIGLEDPNDIIEDLRQALKKIK